MRLSVKQHKDLRQDPQYRQQKEKHKKVKQREEEDREAREEIKRYETSTES